MSAVTEPLVSQPGTSPRDPSRRSELRLVRLARYPKFGPAGQQVGEERGQAVQFREGRLDVPLEGQVELENGDKLPAAEIREWLDNHKLNGSTEEGFWKVDPVAPPVSQEEIASLLSVALDEDALLELIEQERNGWDREALLVPAQEQLEKLRATLAQMQAEVQAEPVKPKPAAKK
jgi:hypothetical protein